MIAICRQEVRQSFRGIDRRPIEQILLAVRSAELAQNGDTNLQLVRDIRRQDGTKHDLKTTGFAKCFLRIVEE